MSRAPMLLARRVDRDICSKLISSRQIGERVTLGLQREGVELVGDGDRIGEQVGNDRRGRFRFEPLGAGGKNFFSFGKRAQSAAQHEQQSERGAKRGKSRKIACHRQSVNDDDRVWSPPPRRA